MSERTQPSLDFSELLKNKEFRDEVTKQPPVPTVRVQFAQEFISKSGVAEQVEEWMQQDRDAAGKRAGGRPAAISTKLLLTLFVILITENTPLHMTRLADLLNHRLSSKACDVLGFEQTGEQPARIYHRLWRATSRMFDSFDPQPHKKRKRYTKAQFDEVLAERERNADGLEVKRRRRDWVMNQLLEASYQSLPAEYRRWEGNIAVDATPVKMFEKGVGKKRLKKMEARGLLSAQPDAGFYGRGGDHRDTEENGSPASKSFYAMEAELLIQTSNNPSLPADFPLCVIGIGFHVPGVAPTERALEAFESVVSRGHKPGYATGDRLYFPNAIAEKLQLPLRAMGYKIVCDYQENQLGNIEQYEGAILVEGNWYSPGMPRDLVNATKVFRDSSHRDYGDFDLYNKRINARTPYLLKRNGSEDADGYSTWMCPAGSRNPTLTCDIKTNMGVNDPASPNNIGRRKSLMPVINLPRSPKGNSICTNKTSVKFPPEAGAKYLQHLQYGTAEWRAMYSTARNTIEGFNAFVKDPGREALDAAARRRLRGVTAQYFLTTLLVAAANLRKISNFLDGISSAAPAEKKVQQRARRRELSPLSPWATGPRTKAQAPPG